MKCNQTLIYALSLFVLSACSGGGSSSDGATTDEDDEPVYVEDLSEKEIFNTKTNETIASAETPVNILRMATEPDQDTAIDFDIGEELNTYRLRFGDDLMTYKAGWIDDQSKPGGVAQYIGDFEINGVPVKNIYTHYPASPTESMIGILENDAGELIVFHNMGFDSLNAPDDKDRLIGVPYDEVAYYQLDRSSQDRGDWVFEYLDVTRETTTNPVSHSIDGLEFHYVTVNSTGLIREFAGGDGTMNFDAGSGVWSAELGSVSLEGELDGIYASGTATYNGIEGSFDATDYLFSEFMVDDPVDSRSEVSEVFGVFSGSNGTDGFAGDFKGEICEGILCENILEQQ